MMLVVLIVLLVAVKAGCAADSDQPLYACPHQSWCVPAKYCPADKVSFHSTTTRNYSAMTSDHVKFMCGVTVDTDGDLCCRELAALPKPFVPTLTRWHFLDKNFSVERLPMQVIAWPGYGTEEPAKPELGTDPHTGAPKVPFLGQLRTTSICPPMSVCVPAYDCPSKSIYYTVDVPSPARGKFLCGVTLGSEGWLCCSLHVIKDAMGEWRRPARHPVPDDHEVLIRISFDSQKLQQRIGADVAQYSRTPHAAAPPSPPLPATLLPDYYEDNHINDVDHALLQGRKLLDAPRRRYRRDAAEVEASLENAESSNETYAIHGAADHGNATLYTVTQATLISDAPPTARSRLPVEEERCGEPLVPHAPHGAPGVPLHAPLEGQYPWHVAVLTSSGEYMCGGVLVTERHVLTVAHCISPRLPSQVVIRVGDFNLLSDSETHPSYDVPVSRITCHPEYSRTTLRADVCVVQLRVAVLWLPNVRRVCLPGETSHPDPTVECLVSSWGYVAKGQDGKIYDSFAPQLRHLPFLAIDGARCQRELRKIKKLGSFFKINSGVLCSKGTASPDTCHGDGGSGLVCRAGSDSQQGQYVLTGLVSWDMGCDNGKPTAYVDVTYFLDFILRTIGATLEGGRLHLSKIQTTGTSDAHRNEQASSQYNAATSAASQASGTSQFSASSQPSGGSHYASQSGASSQASEGSHYVSSQSGASSQASDGSHYASQSGASSQASGGSHYTSSHSSGALYSTSSQSASSYGLSSTSDKSTVSQHGYGATSHSDSGYGDSSHSGSSSYSATSQSDSSYNSQSSEYTAELPARRPTRPSHKQGEGYAQSQQTNFGVHKVDPYLTGVPSRPNRPSTVKDTDKSSVTNDYYDKQKGYSNKQAYSKKYDSSASYEKKDYPDKYDHNSNLYDNTKFNNERPEYYKYDGNRKYDGSDSYSSEKLGYGGSDKSHDKYDESHSKYSKYNTGYEAGKEYSRYDVQGDAYTKDRYVNGYLHKDDVYDSDHYGKGSYDHEYKQGSGYKHELGHNSYNQESYGKEYPNQGKPYHDGKYYRPHDRPYSNEKTYNDYDSKYYMDGKYYDANKHKYLKDGKYYDIDYKEGKYYEDGQYYAYKDGKYYKNGEYYDVDKKYGKYYKGGKLYDLEYGKYFKDGKYYDVDYNHGKYYEDGKYFDYEDFKPYKKYGDSGYGDSGYGQGQYTSEDRYYGHGGGEHYTEHGYYNDLGDYPRKDLDKLGYSDVYREDRGQHDKHYGHDMYYDYNAEHYKDIDYRDGKYYANDGYYSINKHGKYHIKGKYYDMDYKHGKYYKDGKYYDFDDHGKYYKDGKHHDIDYNHGKYYYNGDFYDYVDGGFYMDGKYHEINYDDGKYYEDGKYYSLNRHGQYLKDGKYYDVDYKKGKYYKDGKYHDLNEHGKYFRDGNWYDIDYNHGKYYKDGKFYDLTSVSNKFTGHKDKYDHKYEKNHAGDVLYYHHGNYYPYKDGKYYKNGKYYDVDPNEGKYYENGKYYALDVNGKYYKDGHYYNMDYQRGKYYKDGKLYDLNQHDMYYKDGKYYEIDKKEGQFFSEGIFYSYYEDGHFYDYVENGKYGDFHHEYYDRRENYDKVNYKDPRFDDYYAHSHHGQYGKKPAYYGESGGSYDGYGDSYRHSYIDSYDGYRKDNAYGDYYELGDEYYGSNSGPDEYGGYHNSKIKLYNDQSYGEDYKHGKYDYYKHTYGEQSYKSESYDYKDSKYYKERERYGTIGVHNEDSYGQAYDHSTSKDDPYKTGHGEGPGESGVHYHYRYYRRKSGQGEKIAEGQEKQDYDRLVFEASSEAKNPVSVASDQASQNVQSEANNDAKISDNEIHSASPGSIVGYLKKLQVAP